MSALATATACLSACGHAATLTPSATPPSQATPTASPSIDAAAVTSAAAAALTRAVQEYNDLLNTSAPLLRAGVAQQNPVQTRTAGFRLLSATDAFYDTIRRGSEPLTARADATVLVTTTDSLRTDFDALASAGTWDEVQGALSDLPGAQQAQESAINRVAADLGQPPLSLVRVLG